MHEGPRLLRLARQRAGMSQRALALAAGTSGSTVAAYESETKDPRASTLERLLNAAGAELQTVARRSRNERFVDLLSERLAERILREPALVEAAREMLARLRGRSSWAATWESLLDAGPVACAAVLTSTNPDVRSLKADNPFALLNLVTHQERADMLEVARAT